MGNVNFEVSAKTARLIGRENISDVDGAIVELIKNAYDADATCVFVLFYLPFPKVPSKISYELANEVFRETDIGTLLEYFDDTGADFQKHGELTNLQEAQLSDFLFSRNFIYVIDNGCGMDEQTLCNAWMNIGTNDKEERRVSPKGRVKTGAKGIGRFALDKLSKSTTVYTKSNHDSLKKWTINWEQFETANLLNEVTATIDNCDFSFYQHIKNIIKDNFKAFEKYNWETGTIICLNPIREPWDEEYFTKVNRNLRSLFPSTNNSQFDIYVTNIFYPRLSFENERFALGDTEYDYRIIGSFDGKDGLSVRIYRNEIETKKKKVNRLIDGKMMGLSLGGFWSREAFQKEKYRRHDFSKFVDYSYSAHTLTKIDSTVLEEVGAFTAEFYFLRNTSSMIEIAKPVITSRRKEILASFSGIKLYRDGFKVRPYGEDGGPSFDWLSLSQRAQKSPAAVSNPSGGWRVRSNQIIGEVRITKAENPALEDMANREGLSMNDAFKAFINLITRMIETFESDRQYIFREYAAWLREEEEKLSATHVVIETAKINQGKNPEGFEDADSKEDPQRFDRLDYENAIVKLEEARADQERTNRTMMLYSSAGVMTNTFSHELSHIMTQVGSRMQHLRAAIRRKIGKYEGNEVFNPYKIIDESEEIDKLLESWIGVLMHGMKENAFVRKTNNIYYIVKGILEQWEPLLRRKLIEVAPFKEIADVSGFQYNISEIDIVIILNNFLLNAAYFLERSHKGKRIVSVDLCEAGDNIVLELENNGPPLDGVFMNNPNKIFEAGVSTKTTQEGKGSGLGLWIMQMLVQSNSGSIYPIVPKEDGFALKIIFPKWEGKI